MPFFECSFFSQALQLSTAVNVLVPSTPLAGCPVLYLLHGRSDDHTIWMRRTALERYWEGMRLIVVMPNVHRSYYANMAHGGRFWDFISEELPQTVQDWFSSSQKREDTFVAGLSMGGYGAFKLALTHPARFAAAASLSGALDVGNGGLARFRKEPNPEMRKEWRDIWGDPRKVAGSQNDLFTLVTQTAQAKPQPKLYQACGTEDWLYDENQRFRQHAHSLGLNLTYTEGPGDHNWAYWDMMIERVLAWLPLGKQPEIER